MRRPIYDLAGERLLAHADQPGAWTIAPMRGYRLLGDNHGVLQILDLGPVTRSTFSIWASELGHRPGHGLATRHGYRTLISLTTT